MSKKLLAGIAVLFLATGAAHAAESPDEDGGWTTIIECGDAVLKNYHISDTELYRVELSVRHRTSPEPDKKRVPIVTFNAENQTLTVNGKTCGRTIRR
jgi:hypothetical protein